MRKLVVAEYMTLDGVMEAPEKWSLNYWNDQIAEYQTKQLRKSDLLLLGKNTYDVFSEAWSQRSGDEFTDKMNSMEKRVACGDEEVDSLSWNATPIEGDVVAAVSELKKEDGGDILVYGSRTLLQTLIENKLVDEYRLMVFPLLYGEGMRLFEDGHEANLELVDSKATDNGVMLLTYKPAE